MTMALGLLGDRAPVAAHETLAAGSAALRRSVAEVVSQTLAGVNNIEEARLARGWLGQVLIAAGKPQGVRAQTQTLLNALRNQTMYLADPVHIEWVQRATRTLCLKPGQCNPVEDCDGLSCALATVTILAGIPTQFVEQHWDGAEQDHILIAVRDESGTWLRVDPSTNWPVGKAATADKEVWVDPLKDIAPQLVSLGRIGARTVYEQRFGKTWASRDEGQSWIEVPFMGAATVITTTGPYAQATVDLQNEVIAAAGAGDTYYGQNDFKGAVTAYQAAGNAGATSVGPEIDLAGQPTVTQPYTQQAWTMNAALAAVNSSSPSEADALTAQSYIRQMIVLYEQAITAGGGGGAIVVAPGGSNVGALKALGVAAGVGAATGLAYYFWQRSRRRQ
jgi:hypothetical protein